MNVYVVQPGGKVVQPRTGVGDKNVESTPRRSFSPRVHVARRFLVRGWGDAAKGRRGLF